MMNPVSAEKGSSLHRRILSLSLAALMLLLPVRCPLAEDDDEWKPKAWTSENYPLEDLYLVGDTVDWETLGVKKNSSWDVYSAPFDDAWRAANGKAKVSAAESFDVLGTVENGAWSWIRYKTSGGAERIGWARIPDTSNEYGDTFPAGARLSRLTRDENLTDDPYGKKKAAVRLRKGDRLIAFCAMDDGWAYVETEVDGKTAWLFIPQDALEPVPIWELSEDGKTVTVLDGVTRMGMSYTDSSDDSWEDEPEVRKVSLRKHDIVLPILAIGEDVPYSVETLILPDSLRFLGGESIVYGHLKTVRLPDSAELDTAASAFYGTDIDTLIIPASVQKLDTISAFDHARIGTFRVGESSRYLRDVDGVLFTADGKTLLRYPEGRKDKHYDVPAGTEEIASRAFYSDGMSIPLTTISLPDGLKTIGEHAFSGCGRLISLNVPLTVTGLAKNAFSDCVSLERLSLPPGLSAEFDDSWSEPGDFTYYNGDNATTYAREPEPDDDWDSSADYVSCFYEAVADTPDGTGSIPWYASRDAQTPAGEIPAGTRIYVSGLGGGRAMQSVWDEEYRYIWYRTEDLQPLTGDVFFTPVEFYVSPADQTRPAGDGRDLGILYAGKTKPVYLLDAPGGSPVGHVWEEQAQALETDGGWIHVMTARGEGWVSASDYIPVPVEP